MTEIGTVIYQAEWRVDAGDGEASYRSYKHLQDAITQAREADVNREGRVYEQQWDGKQWEDIRIHTVYGESYSPNMFE